MDDHTFENWIRVKDALEEAGKTDCLFYRRATTIVNGGKLTKDPFGYLLLSCRRRMTNTFSFL